MEKVLNGKIINEKKVWSANKLYKLFGILMNIGGFLLIFATIYMFFNMTNSEVIGGLFIMPIPIILAFVVGKSLLKAYSDWNLFYKPESLYMEE